MTVKSVVEVDVQAQEFGKFAELFDKYQAQLAKTPNAWKAAGGQAAAMATQFERMSAALLAQNELNRQHKEDDEHHLKNLQQSESLWHRISTHSNSLFSNVLGISGQFLKWGGLLAGTAVGVTTGSLFGYDRLVSGIGGERQEAKGLGLSIGQQRALGIDLGRFGDVQGLAQSVLGAETNPAQRTAWYALGLGAPTGNMSTDLVRMLTAERAFALRTPLSVLGTMAQAYQLPSSLEDLMRLRATGNPEFNRQIANYQRDAATLNISDRSAETAQNVQAQFSRAWKQMETGLWGALAPLSGPIIRLSQAFTHAATAVLGSPAVKAGIKDFADWISKFSTTLNSKEFDQKLKGFTSNVGVVADGVHLLADAFKIPVTAAHGWEKLWGWAKVGAQNVSDFAQSSNNAAWNLFTPDSNSVLSSGLSPNGSSAGALADWYLHTGVSASALRNAELPGTASQMNVRIPSMPQAQIAPIQVNITKATGADIIVTVNGLAGH